MLGLISIIVNGGDNSVCSEKQGNGCCIGGEMPASIKILVFNVLLNEQLSGFFKHGGSSAYKLFVIQN